MSLKIQNTGPIHLTAPEQIVIIVITIIIAINIITVIFPKQNLFHFNKIQISPTNPHILS